MQTWKGKAYTVSKSSGDRITRPGHADQTWRPAGTDSTAVRRLAVDAADARTGRGVPSARRCAVVEVNRYHVTPPRWRTERDVDVDAGVRKVCPRATHGYISKYINNYHHKIYYVQLLFYSS